MIYSPGLKRLAASIVLTLIAGSSAVAGSHGNSNVRLASDGRIAGDSLQQTVEDIMQPAVAERGIPALIVAVSLHGVRHFYSFSGTGEALPGADTIFEIGSITKVFTTALLGEAIKAGQIVPDMSIQTYLPNLALQPCAQRVTPIQLADFTSGMPEMPADAPKPVRDRGLADYTERDFLHWVGRWSPGDDGACNLPAPYVYSNASVGLLGLIVANAMGNPWRQLVAERITRPLGMRDTAIDPTDRDRLVQGHGRDGRSVIPWPVTAWYAAGALRSTAQDMLSFGEAAIGHSTVNGAPVPPVLGSGFRLAMTPLYRPDGRAFQQAMSWAVAADNADGGPGMMSYKDGGTDGFNSVIAVDPSKDAVIFIAANKAKTGIPQLGEDLMKALR